MSTRYSCEISKQGIEGFILRLERWSASASTDGFKVDISTALGGMHQQTSLSGTALQHIPVHPDYPLVNIQKTVEHGPVEIVDLPIKHGDFP